MIGDGTIAYVPKPLSLRYTINNSNQRRFWTLLKDELRTENVCTCEWLCAGLAYFIIYIQNCRMPSFKMITFFEL